MGAEGRVGPRSARVEQWATERWSEKEQAGCGRKRGREEEGASWAAEQRAEAGKMGRRGREGRQGRPVGQVGSGAGPKKEER